MPAEQRAIDELKSMPAYVEAFKKAFPDDSDPLVYDNVGRAIALFEGTLITPDAPFDRWLTGDATAAAGSNALTLATVNANVGSFGNLRPNERLF